MVIIDKTEDCTGCSACYNVCPQNSISMDFNDEGFFYPKINESTCINCGQCRNVCPVNLVVFKKKDDLPFAFLCTSKEERVCIDSASGGLFTSIAYSFMKRYHGVVYGAAYNNKFEVIHKRIDDIDKIKEFSKSKYVQSQIGTCYKSVRQDLRDNKKVLFSGTPCQVYGLKSFLKKEYENLYCIDVVCYGVPSPFVYKSYLSWLKSRYGDIIKIIFRDKILYKTFYRGGMGIQFTSGYKYFMSSELDPYGQFFLGHLSIRKSCHNCKYKSLWRLSDLTLGDCWFAEELIGKRDNIGYTLALQQSVKGSELLEMSKCFIYLYNIDSLKSIKLNGGMIYSSCKCNPFRDSFFKDIRQYGFAFCVKKYSKAIPLKHKIMTSLKNAGIIPSFFIRKKHKKEFEIRLRREIPVGSFGIITLGNKDEINKKHS